MADLRSEIEARKSRIAELKRQREALALSGAGLAPSSAPQPPQSSQLSLVSMVGPRIEIEAPFLYNKSVQASIQASPPSLKDDSLLDSQLDPQLDPQLGSDSHTTNNNGPAPAQEQTQTFKIMDPYPSNASSFPPSLITFLDNSWRAVARSSAGPPVLRDYTVTQSNSDHSNAKAVTSPTAELVNELDAASSLVVWSPHFNELFLTVASDYRRACLWSTDALARPEFTLRSPTVLKQLLFSPYSAQYIYGGGANGQVFAWDLKDLTTTRGARFDILPQLQSSIENDPVIAMTFVGSSLLSLNENGILSVWNTDSLSRPRHYIILEDVLRQTFNALKLTVSPVPTAMAASETLDSTYGLGYGIGTCVIGTIQGYLLRVPSQSGSPPPPPPPPQQQPHDWRHRAAVTCLQFRKTAPPSIEEARTGSVLLSGGLDWKLRVWFVPNAESEKTTELLTLNIDFAVAHVAWHPTIHSVFAAAGESQIQLWNLDINTVKPIFTHKLDDDEVTAVEFSSHSAFGVAGKRCVQLFALKQDDPLLKGSDNWILANERYRHTQKL